MIQPNRPPNHKSGFTLIELVVVLLIVGILIGIVAPRVQGQSSRARDTRRVQDLRVWVDAIEQYKLDTGDYPNHGTLIGGWDRTSDGEFIPELLDQGYVRSALTDPLEDSSHYFVYRRFAPGTYGCVGPENYYVIAILNFETDSARDDFQTNFRCTGYDFAAAYDYATGGGASYQ